MSVKSKITVVTGDIIHQKVDAIVNPANSSLLGGGGVDGAIHQAAGPELYEECRKLRGCTTGEAKLTRGHRLPAKWIIHTVGPIWKDGTRGEEEKLAKCYRSCFELVEKHALRTVAFPAISTGAYGFPHDKAAKIAVTEAVRFLKSNCQLEKIIFVCWDKRTFESYSLALGEVVETKKKD